MNQDFYRVVFLPLKWKEEKRKINFLFLRSLKTFLLFRNKILPSAYGDCEFCYLYFTIYLHCFLNLRSFRGKTPTPFEGRFTN